MSAPDPTPEGTTLSVAIVTTALAGGGAEFVARTWACWLADQGHAVRVFVLSRSDADPIHPGVQIIALGGGSHGARVGAMRRSLTADPADVVLSLQAYPNLVASVAVFEMGRTRPTLITSERNITMREAEPTPLRARAVAALANLATRHSDLVIAVSHAVGGILVSSGKVRGDRVVIVPNPAGVRDEERAVGTPRRVSADGGITLVLPLRLVRQKRPELAVAAAAELVRRGRTVSLLCYGQGPERDALLSTAAARGVSVTMAGWVADWAADAPADAIALLPSYREGFGNVLVEAASAGLRSVAVSNSFGVADALVPGVTGQLALVGTPESVADAIERADAMPPVTATTWAERFGTATSGRLLLAAFRKAMDVRSDR